MANGRNELYPNPFDEFDPHHTMRGKKAFNSNKVRCLQPKIDLQDWQNDVPEKQKSKKTPFSKEFLNKID
jgi:hypothetical protein